MTFSFRPIYLPAEIWEMPQLRHLKKEDGEFYLPDPLYTKSKKGGRYSFVLKNLQTLYTMKNFRCTDEVVHRIPNWKNWELLTGKFPAALDSMTTEFTISPIYVVSNHFS